MTEQELINQLKAQVNCLREALLSIALPTGGDDYTKAHAIAIKALEVTPKQCLAEVKALASEEVAETMKNDINYTYNDDYYISFIYMQADKFREQAK